MHKLIHYIQQDIPIAGTNGALMVQNFLRLLKTGALEQNQEDS